MYDLPPEIDVKADGPLRIITLNRPDSLNSVNDALHVRPSSKCGRQRIVGVPLHCTFQQIECARVAVGVER